MTMLYCLGASAPMRKQLMSPEEGEGDPSEGCRALAHTSPGLTKRGEVLMSVQERGSTGAFWCRELSASIESHLTAGLCHRLREEQ